MSDGMEEYRVRVTETIVYELHFGATSETMAQEAHVVMNGALFDIDPEYPQDPREGMHYLLTEWAKHEIDDKFERFDQETEQWVAV